MLIIIFFRLSHQATAEVIDHVLANVMPAAVEVTAGRSSPSPRGGGRYVHSNHRACTAPDTSLTRTITCSALFAIVLTSPRTRTRIRAHAYAHTHTHTHTRTHMHTRTRTRTRTAHARYAMMLRLLGGSYLTMPSFSILGGMPSVEASVAVTRKFIASGMIEVVVEMLAALFPPPPSAATSATAAGARGDADGGTHQGVDMMVSADADVDFVFCEVGFFFNIAMVLQKVVLTYNKHKGRDTIEAGTEIRHPLPNIAREC